MGGMASHLPFNGMMGPHIARYIALDATSDSKKIISTYLKRSLIRKMRNGILSILVRSIAAFCPTFEFPISAVAKKLPQKCQKFWQSGKNVVQRISPVPFHQLLPPKVWSDIPSGMTIFILPMWQNICHMGKIKPTFATANLKVTLWQSGDSFQVS